MRNLVIALLVTVLSVSATAQVSPEEARARLAARERERAAAATQPVAREELDRLRRENVALKAEVAKLTKEIEEAKATIEKLQSPSASDKGIPAAIHAGKILKGMTLDQVCRAFGSKPVSTTETSDGTIYIFEQYTPRGLLQAGERSVETGGALIRRARVVISDGKVIDFADRKTPEFP